MKIHWFSPLPPARTDIANYTFRVLPSLAERAEVTLWTDSSDVVPELSSYADVRVWGDPPHWEELNRADAVFYNFGNDGRFHTWILDVARKHPGIAILHDINLHEFLAGYFREHLNSPLEYVKLLRRFHGEEGASAGTEVIAGPREAHEIADSYPLSDYFLQISDGIVSHNPSAALPLVAKALRPILSLPLPYGQAHRLRPLLDRTHRENSPIGIILFGFLHGENRRLLPFLEAFAQLPDQDRFTITFAGEYPPPAVMRSHLEKLGVSAPCRMLGFLEEGALEAELDAADLAINLRYPTRGEASGSQLRIWNHSLPSLVTRSGYYAALPEDAVAFVRPEHETEDILEHLTAFATTPRPYRSMGLRGHALLRAHHTSGIYVDRILAFLENVREARPHNVMERTAIALAETHIAPLPNTYLQQHLVHSLSEQIGYLAKTAFRPMKADPHDRP